MSTKMIEERRTFSQKRLDELGENLLQKAEISGLGELCVYATGSFARREASPHSDIDLFFLHRGSSSSERVARLDELRLFAAIIEIAERMDFPAFSNDGEFLEILYINDMLMHLGSPADDFENFFTARMLLLLESAPLVNREMFDDVVTEIVEAYFRDYPDHSHNFRPVFLINDIIRFWKTLCLNYEHRRNRPEDAPETKRRQQVKNFKLKMSRLMTCFGTIGAICSMSPPIDPEDIVELTKSTPLSRLDQAIAKTPELAKLRTEILDDYRWFMELTALTTDELHAKFDHSTDREKLFGRADLFGERIYKVIDHLASENHYRRYLIV